MKNTERLLRIFALPLLLFSLGCRKDHRMVDAGILPETDRQNAAYIGNLAVEAFSQGPDSIPSLNSRFKYFGSNLDPQFGLTNIGLYLNANTDKTFIDLDSTTSQSADIIIVTDPLNLAGDPDATLSYSIFTIDTDLSTTKVYYTSNTRLHSKTQLGGTFSGKRQDFKSKKVIRIPVDSNFVKALMADRDFLVSNEVFQSKYKGFYIAASTSSEGAIFNCDLSDEVSGFYLYFKKDTIPDTFRFAFSGERAVRFNTVGYDAANANPLLKNQLNGDSTSGHDALFLKGMGVTKLKVSIPFLKNYGDTFQVGVNNAEVIFYIDPAYDNNKYRIPPKLSLLPITSSGLDTFAVDQTNSTDNIRYRGVYQGDKNAYVFNIARHAQAILNGEIQNRGFHLVMSDPDKLLTARQDNFNERAVIYGTRRSQFRPVLNFSYMRLNTK